MSKLDKTLLVAILTANCAQTAIDVEAFTSQLNRSIGDRPDLLVLSLQEIAPPAYALRGGCALSPYFDRFDHAVRKASERYTRVFAENIGLTALFVFTRDVATVRDVEVASVGLSAWDIGYKGAVAARFTYKVPSASVKLTFVAAHLAAHENAVEQRNEDWSKLVRGLAFEDPQPVGTHEDEPLLASGSPASIYSPDSHLFVAGDLNYRTSTHAPVDDDPETKFPQPWRAADSPRHHLALLPRDQLTQERLAGRTCQGLVEAPIEFSPTYKFQRQSPSMESDEQVSEWHWARHRWPSWCDRILYLPMPPWMASSQAHRDIRVEEYTALPRQPTTDHKAVLMRLRLPLLELTPPAETGAQEDPRLNPPFSINMDWRARRQVAQRWEYWAGVSFYATTTWEGRLAAVSTVVGLLGAIYILRAVLGG